MEAVPNPPLYIFAHGNSATVWKRQADLAKRWMLPRVPHWRIRPLTSFSGGGHVLAVPRGCEVSYGAELGVVLGREACQVPEEGVVEYIAGVTCLNDLFLSGAHSDFSTQAPPERFSTHQQYSLDTLAKAADGCGAMGPRVVPLDELTARFAEQYGRSMLQKMAGASRTSAPLYNLVMRTGQDGAYNDRSYTGAYLLGAEYLIAYLSRFMTLPAGTVVGLGAAGWDGNWTELGDAPGSQAEVMVDLEHVGELRTRLVRASGLDEPRESPFLAAIRSRGVRQVPRGKSLWMLRGNYRGADRLEGIPEWVGLCPFLCPDRSVDDSLSPIVLPPSAGMIRCSAELAAVIGPVPVYNVAPADALDRLEGTAVMLSVVDTSLTDPLRDPNDYECRSAYVMGAWGDGFHRLGSTVPLSGLGDARPMRVWCSSGRQVETSTAAYRRGLGEMIAMVSRMTTLLPGDVVSLGPAGEGVSLPPSERLGNGVTLGAAVDGIGEIALPVVDERHEEARDREFR